MPAHIRRPLRVDSGPSGLISQRRGGAESSHSRHRNRLVGSTKAGSKSSIYVSGLETKHACQHFDMLELKLDSITHFQRIFSSACHRCSIDYAQPNVFLIPLSPFARSTARVYHEPTKSYNGTPKPHETSTKSIETSRNCRAPDVTGNREASSSHTASLGWIWTAAP